MFKRRGSTPVTEVVASVRPRRVRQVTVAISAVVLVIFVYSGWTLTGTTAYGGKLFSSDNWALIGVGVLLAGVALVPLRISVRADDDGIRIRNLVGDLDLQWPMVRAIRYQRGAPWASVELVSGDLIPVLAVQVSDGQRAVDAIRTMRRLHAAALERDLATDPGQ